ncbi:MAG TPA: helix-turn-helix transcriptional regulator [Solirubrobacterales bacterium]
MLNAERVIRERYGEFDLGLVEVAEDLGCSTRQLQRVFREVGGTDFRSFLLRVRMEQAYRLLSRKKDGLTVRAAARAVGYREASGLRQQFVRFYGYNPSAVQPEGPNYSELWRAVEQSELGSQSMSGAAAWQLIEEALALEAQGTQREATWATLKGPILNKTERAVLTAPKDPVTLYMATRLLYLYREVDENAATQLAEYQNRLDSLGGPNADVLELAGGKANYDSHRAMVLSSR